MDDECGLPDVHQKSPQKSVDFNEGIQLNMKIICIGRNYAEHAKELGNKVPEKPIIFLKPDSALIPKGHPFFYPEFTKDLHFEVELVVKINRVGKKIEEKFAHKYYNEVGIGIDFTARDIQQDCKEKLRSPWSKVYFFI